VYNIRRLVSSRYTCDIAFNGSFEHKGEYMERITIGVVNHNGLHRIRHTLKAIQNLDYPSYEVYVIDNHSTDGSCEWIRQAYPEVRCITLNQNHGPNVARQLILEQADSAYVLIMDDDIVMARDALTRLVTVMRKVNRAGVCHLEIKDCACPEAAYHYNGGSIHYLCALVPRDKPTDHRPEYEIFDTVSGQAMLIDRDAALSIGGFDNDYFFGWTDGDFTARMSLAGFLCLNVPQAVGWHTAHPRGVSKAFYQVRNRWYFMIKLYSWRTLMLSAPMLLLYEFALMLLLVFKGAGKEYWRGMKAVVHDLPMLLRKRRLCQQLKVRRDRDWLFAGELYIPHGLIANPAACSLIRLFSHFVGLYWRLIRPLC